MSAIIIIIFVIYDDDDDDEETGYYQGQKAQVSKFYSSKIEFAHGVG